jgi:two-component system, OmpR family, phosphate regulon response regulator PhoB
VARPFDPGETVRRIMAVLRRASPDPDRPRRGPLGSGPIRLDQRNHSLIVDGREAVLPKGELEVLAILMAHENSLVSRTSLSEALNLPPGGSRSVDMRVQRVRRRLGRYASWIETVHGQGYRYRNPDRGIPRREEVA